MLTSLAVACLFQTASCQTEEEQDPAVTINPVPHSVQAPARSWKLDGRGDGQEHDFIYTTWANPGLLEISVRAQSQRWLSHTTLTLEDSTGRPLTRIRASVGSDSGLEAGTYRLLTRQPLRLHVHVDENAGPYSISVSGPIDR
jgi:hypothetical protein|eukprot:TRINITY_DN48551_c0_g1_i1.p1 TRINITY_DN48551_c0_g1~~TRINITY_DN48551_c0_g1_i1.p1  ORF type:complete len:143 (-),score=16.58 TRINITY_DN48551_c0_g1_i1:7-435(-)